MPDSEVSYRVMVQGKCAKESEKSQRIVELDPSGSGSVEIDVRGWAPLRGRAVDIGQQKPNQGVTSMMEIFSRSMIGNSGRNFTPCRLKKK